VEDVSLRIARVGGHFQRFPAVLTDFAEIECRLQASPEPSPLPSAWSGLGMSSSYRTRPHAIVIRHQAVSIVGMRGQLSVRRRLRHHPGRRHVHRTASHASPAPSRSVSTCDGLATSGQLSTGHWLEEKFGLA